MHVLLLGYRPALKKNFNFVFLFIRKGYKVFFLPTKEQQKMIFNISFSMVK